MSGNPAQGGVRSLLAKFENNQNSTSPPSRGRSPVAPETPGLVRPLSKVRASFVAVEKSTQGMTMVGLRKANEDDSPVRLRGSALEDGDAKRRSVPVFPENAEKPADTSSTPSPQSRREFVDRLQHNGVDSAQPPPGNPSGRNGVAEASLPIDQASAQEDAVPSVETSPVGQKMKPTPHAIEKSKEVTSQKKAPASRTVTKRLSNISIARDISGNKQGFKSSLTKDLKSPASKTPEMPGSTILPNARSSDKATGPKKGPTRVASKPSTNSPVKPAHSQTPSQEIAKKSNSSGPNSPPKNNSQQKSPTHPIRLPPSMISPTASSVAKIGPGTRSSSRTNTTSPGLTKKSPTLTAVKASEISSRLTAPTASSLRKQPSRQSLPAQLQHERPRSRIGLHGTRVPDESFLARMTRPTASFASKMHEKVEPKSPPTVPKVIRPAKKNEDKVEGHMQKLSKVEDTLKTGGDGNVKEHKDTKEECLATSTGGVHIIEHPSHATLINALREVEKATTGDANLLMAKLANVPAETSPDTSTEPSGGQAVEVSLEVAAHPKIDDRPMNSTEATTEPLRETSKEPPTEAPTEHSNPPAVEGQAEDPIKSSDNHTDGSLEETPSAIKAPAEGSTATLTEPPAATGEAPAFLDAAIIETDVD